MVTAGARPADAVGDWLLRDVARGAAAFQRDSDGLGVTRLVDGAAAAAFSCDQDLVLRQSMADHGWRAPQFVASRPPSADAAGGVDLPGHATLQTPGRVVEEPGCRRVWHVSVASVAPAAAPACVDGRSAAAAVADVLVRAAGVRLVERVPAAPPDPWALPSSAVHSPIRPGVDHREWTSSVLRAVLSAVAFSYPANRLVQAWAFERFLVRSLGGAPSRDSVRGLLRRAYWAVAQSLARVYGITLAPGEGNRVVYEPRIRTLVLGPGPGGPRRSIDAVFEVAAVCPDSAVRAAADARDWARVLRASGVGGPVSRPDLADTARWAARASLAAAFAAKRVAERVGLPYSAAAHCRAWARASVEVLRREGWRSIAIEAGNLAGWVVDRARGLACCPLALE